MFIDRTEKSVVGSVSVSKLHGHTVLTLTDAKTGKELKRIEKDNLVTGAVAQIFAQNYLGAIKYADITPVRDMFGGVLLFYDALTESEDTVQLPDPSANPVIAYAGQTAHATANPKRGNPNNAQGGSGPTLDGKGYKFVWDWATNQGNGTISAAALTYKNFGDIGPDPNPCVDSELPFIYNGNKSAVTLTGDRAARGSFASQLHNLVCVTDGGATGYHFDLASATLTKLALNYKAQGVNNVLTGASVVSTKTFESTPTKYGGITWEASTGLFYIVDFPDTSTCTITEYDPSTDTSTTKTFSRTGVTFNRVNTPYDPDDNAPCFINKFAKCGNYFFVYGGTGMYRLDWTQPSDIEAIDFTNWDTNERSFAVDLVNGGQIAAGDSVCVGSGYIINGLKIYTTEQAGENERLASVTNDTVWNLGYNIFRHALTDDPHIQIPWIWAYGYRDNTVVTMYGALMYSYYLATVQNLEDVVTKDSTMTMKVVYTITVDDTPEP